MLAFYQHWIWDVLHSFLVKEGYTPCNESPGEVTKRIQEIIHTHNWDSEPVRRIASLYVTGKAMSLSKHWWLWRPIAALPNPCSRK